MPSWNSPFVQFGVGAFETLRCERGFFPLEKWHRRRLGRALKAWGLPEKHLDAAWNALLERGQALKEHPYRRVKLLVGLGEKDELLYHVFDVSFEPNSIQRTLKVENQLIFLPQRFKTSSYEEHYWARRRASADGVSDVLYISDHGEMLEASTSCLLLWNGSQFLIRDGGPVLESSSLTSLRERYPEAFEVISDFQLDLTQNFPLIMMSALNGMASVGALVENGETRDLLPIDGDLLSSWNHRLFSSSKP